MKVLYKVLIAVLIVSFTASFSACSKKSYAGKSKKGTAAGIDPVSKKSEPVRKNYIIPNKQKKILGTQKSKI